MYRETHWWPILFWKFGMLPADPRRRLEVASFVGLAPTENWLSHAGRVVDVGKARVRLPAGFRARVSAA